MMMKVEACTASSGQRFICAKVVGTTSSEGFLAVDDSIRRVALNAPASLRAATELLASVHSAYKGFFDLLSGDFDCGRN